MRRDRNALKLKGTFTMAKYSDDKVSLTVEDKDANVIVIEINMTLIDFARSCIGSLGCVPCEFDLNTSGLVGKKREHKRENVPIPDWQKRDKAGKWIEECLKPFEVDGWHGDVSDMENTTHRHHRNPDGSRYADVMFDRWVPKAIL